MGRQTQAELQKTTSREEQAAERARIRAQAASDKKDLVLQQTAAEIKLAKKQAYEDVQAAKKKAEYMQELKKQRLHQKKREEATAKREQVKTEYARKQQLVAQRKERDAEKATQRAKSKKLAVEDKSAQSVRAGRSSVSKVELRKKNFEREIADATADKDKALLQAERAATLHDQEAERLRAIKREAADDIAEAERVARVRKQHSRTEARTIEREESDRVGTRRLSLIKGLQRLGRG